MTRPSLLGRGVRRQAGHGRALAAARGTRRRSASIAPALRQAVAAAAATPNCGSSPASSGAHLLDAHLEVVPGRLPGHRIGVGVAMAVRLRRQQFGDDVVEQEAAAWTSGASAARFQAPARLPMAFQVHTVSGLTPSISLICAFTLAVHGFRSRPSRRRRGRAARRSRAMDEQAVPAVDLPQPGVLRAPGMIHLHRPLRHARAAGSASLSTAALLERRVPERQRVEVGARCARAARSGGWHRAVALARRAGTCCSGSE